MSYELRPMALADSPEPLTVEELWIDGRAVGYVQEGDERSYAVLHTTRVRARSREDAAGRLEAAYRALTAKTPGLELGVATVRLDLDAYAGSSDDTVLRRYYSHMLKFDERVLASRLSRDEAVYLRPGVRVVKGGFWKSAGTTARPVVGPLPGTVLEIEGVSLQWVREVLARGEGDALARALTVVE